MKVTNICVPGVFTLDEAKELIPLVKRIFTKHEKEIRHALDQQRFFIKTQAPQAAVTECDTKVSQELIAMGRKFVRLGINVMGDGYLGFNSGEWYWSYRQGEENINYFHGYFEDPRIVRHKIGLMEIFNEKT